MTTLVELAVEAVALGGIYGLIALGFVVVYKATGVINFAHGTFMALGAYLGYNASVTWGLGFAPAVVVSMALTAGAAVVAERLVLRRLATRPAHAVIMATIGLAIAGDQVLTMVWGFDHFAIGDPWGSSSVRVAGVSVASVDLATMAGTAAAVTAVAAFFTRTPLGLSMRARASDAEAAMVCGVSTSRVDMAAWGLAAALAALAGVFLASGTASVHPDIGYQALRAFPAVVLAGLVSVPGAVAGGLVVGAVEVFTAGYAPVHAPWLGVNLHQVTPYLAMLAVLWVRPSGLFTTGSARRL